MSKYLTLKFILIISLFTMNLVNAQEVRVIDNKGTIKTIRNNQVTTSVTEPAIKFIGDVWFDTSGSTPVSKIYDGTNWLPIEVDGIIGNESVTDLTFDGTTLTLVQDGAASETVNLSTVSTDDQKIDVFVLNADGKNLDLSLEDDSESNKQVDLSALKVSGDVTGTLAATTVEKIQNIAVSTTDPTDGQALVYDSVTSKYEPTTVFIPTVAERYPSATQTIAESATFTIINFQSQDFAPTATDYTVATDGITVLKPGRYKITYRITSENINNNRAGGEFQMTKNGTAINNTKAYTYNRNTVVNKNTVTVVKIIDLVASDKIGVEGLVYASNRSVSLDSLTILPEGTMLTVEKIN